MPVYDDGFLGSVARKTNPRVVMLKNSLSGSRTARDTSGPARGWMEASSL